MDSESTNSSSQPSAKASDVEHSAPAVAGHESNQRELASMPSVSGPSSWALKMQQSLGGAVQESQSGMSALARFTRGFGSQMPSVDSSADKEVKGSTESQQSGVFESFTKGLVGSSRSAVKAMQVKARHIVSQNKRRYQVGSSVGCFSCLYGLQFGVV